MASYLDGTLQQFSNGAIFRPVSFMDFNNTIGNTYGSSSNNSSNNNSSNNTGMIGSILGGAGSLIGSIGNLFGQRAANKTNIAINKMNNEFNERMLEKQMAYNLDMWQRTNEYNTPAAMRQRLVAAGFNPYMAISGGGSVAGNASSSPSAGLASSSGNAHVDPVQFDTYGFNSAMQNVSNDRLRNTEADLNNISAMTQYSRDLADLANTAAEAGNKQSSTALNKLNAQFMDETWQTMKGIQDAQLFKTSMEGRLAAAQATLTNSQNEQVRQAMAFFPYEAQARIAQAYASAKMYDANAIKAVAEAAESEARKYGIDIQNKIAEGTWEKYVEMCDSNYQRQIDYNNAYDGTSAGTRQKIIDGWQGVELSTRAGANKAQAFSDYGNTIINGARVLVDGFNQFMGNVTDTNSTVTEYDRDGNAGRRTTTNTRVRVRR